MSTKNVNKGLVKVLIKRSGFQCQKVSRSSLIGTVSEELCEVQQLTEVDLLW